MITPTGVESREPHRRGHALLVLVSAALGLAPLLVIPARGAFSGGNGRIALESNRDGYFQIYTMGADGSDPARITGTPSIDRQPAWSPDGKKLAFTSNRSGRFEIWISNADGSEPRRLTASDTRDIYPAWSPDGTRIAFARTNSVTGADDIWVAEVSEGGSVTRLTPDDVASETQPSWSPDGTKIAFVTDVDGDLEIYVMGADGDSPVNISRSLLSNEISPDWSPDGARIAFETDRVDGFGRIFTMRADGGAEAELDGSVAGDGQPAWSPDGTEITFVGYRDGTDALALFRMVVGDPASRTPVEPTESFGFDDLRPDWQPIPAEEPQNRPPVAEAGQGGTVGCAPAEGARVVLDGSASSDLDSSPGTNDDIVSFEWFLEYGQPSESLIATGALAEAVLPAGRRIVTLKVTDRAGATATDDVIWTISADTTPPELTVSVVPAILWPPDHRMVPVQASAAAADACGDVVIRLDSVTSSEPDDARGDGDGRTTEDIQGVEIGTADLELALRAERLAGGSGRVYTLVYSATDEAGNVSTTRAYVKVPHDQTGDSPAGTGGTGSRARESRRQLPLPLGRSR